MPSAGLGDRAARPPFMRSQVEQSGGKVRIVVPGPGFRLHLLLGFVLPAAILGYLIPSLLEFFWKTHTPEYVQIFFVGFILLFFCLLPSIGTVNGIIRAIRGRLTPRPPESRSRSRLPGANGSPICRPVKFSALTTAPLKRRSVRSPAWPGNAFRAAVRLLAQARLLPVGLGGYGGWSDPRAFS
jgi:hypothetical protein